MTLCTVCLMLGLLIFFCLFNINVWLSLLLFSGGKTPDPKARTYTDVMKEQSLKKQEVRGEREGEKGRREDGREGGKNL